MPAVAYTLPTPDTLPPEEAAFTVEEYLALDAASERRWEYDRGRIWLMAGAKPAHMLLVTNLVYELQGALRDGPCRVYANDLRVRDEDATGYFYPDVVVGCEPQRFTPSTPPILLNPRVIVEVLSDSTESYDLTDKLRAYQRIASLDAYVVLWQTEARARVWTRSGADWDARDLTGLDATLALEALGVSLPLEEIYRHVELDPQA